MKKKVVNLMNKEVSEVELPESVFGIKVFPDILHQLIWVPGCIYPLHRTRGSSNKPYEMHFGLLYKVLELPVWVLVRKNISQALKL